MAITSGSRLGPYEVVARIGSGGMGEVYSARDSRLDRLVAIKVLPDRMASDPDRRRRFDREAKAAAALNHPNICVLHEVGHHEGHAFLVMEHIAGRSMRQLIPENGLPTETVLHYGVQIAEAIAYAHDRGVVHRDLKSGNVMVTEAGLVKVVDFGLAKQSRPVGDGGSSTMSLTGEGRIVGTLDYMAPEVLVGEPADERSDIWAIGVLLHVMTSGSMPFSGRTTFELTSAILREPPTACEKRVPAGLRSVIRRCLAKEPAQRYQRASEVRAALETAREQISSSDLEMTRSPHDEAITEIHPDRVVAGESPGSQSRSANGSISSVEVETLVRVARSVVLILKSLGVLVAAVAVFGVIGFICAATFDFALRVPMQHDPLELVILGVRSVVPVVARLVLTAVPLCVVLALWRLAMQQRAVGSRGGLADRLRERLDAVNPAALVAGFVILCATGLYGVRLAGWKLFATIDALVEQPVDTAVDTSILGYESYAYQNRFYWACLGAIAVVMVGWALLRRSLENDPDRLTSLRLTHVVAAVSLLSVVVLSAAPWRLLFDNERPQMEFEGRTAFIVAEVDDRVYLYVPGVPRSRVQVAADDPRVEDRSSEVVTANMFDLSE